MKINVEAHQVLIPLLTALLIFLACPLFIASQNAAEISTFPLGALAKNGLFLSALFFVAYFSIMLLLKKFRLTNSIAIFLLSFVFLAIYIFPLSIAPGMVEPEEHGINSTNLAVTLLVSAVVAGVSAVRHDVFKFALVALVAMSGVNFVFSIININAGYSASATARTDKFTHISNKRSILVISFDGIPGVVVSDLLNSSDEYGKILKDFTYFPNTYSQSPATFASGLGSIYGTQDFKSLGKSAKEVTEKIKDTELQKNLYFSKIEDFKHSYSGLPFYPRSSPFEAYEKHTVSFIIESGLSRIFTRHIFKTGFPQLVSAVVFSEKAHDKPSPEKHHGAKWDFRNVASIGRLSPFIKSFSASDDVDFSVRYLHLVYTHFPVDLDAQCKYRSDSKEWFDANQNYDGIKNETICVFDNVAALIKKLKKIGVYDNATIVLKSDHGKPRNFYTQPPNSVTFNNHVRWGYDRYRPFLMIKAMSASNPSINVDNRMVFINDLAKTLCLDSKVQNIDCSVYNGLDLLSDDPEPDEPFYLYIVKDADSKYTFETHTSVEFPNRDLDVLEFLASGDAVQISGN